MPTATTSLTMRRSTAWKNEGRVVFRYAEGTNPNGSRRDIAGILNEAGNVLGMMPHPEDLTDVAQGGTDGLPLFEGLAAGLMEKAA